MARIEAIWEKVWQSLWLIPMVMTLAAVVLAYGLVEIDRRLLAEDRAVEAWWVFAAGAAGARETLGAISSSVITVTGVIFSVTIVALQLASSQFTPRVLRAFLKDRTNHVVLGTFIATFTYSLLVGRTVRSAEEDVSAFVPSIAVTAAVVLTLASIAALIFFINHIVQSMRVSNILERVTKDALELVDKLFPQQLGWPAGPAGPAGPTGEIVERGEVGGAGGTQGPRRGKRRGGRPWTVAAAESGYLDALDEAALFRLAEEGHYTVEMACGVGDFLLRGEALAEVWYRDGHEPGELGEKVRSAFILGPERTTQQDLERSVVELVDIAVRALSPSVNDPTTAMQCLDRLGEVLMELGNRRFPVSRRTGPDGRVVLVARRVTYGSVVELAFDQVRHHAASTPEVVIRLLEMASRVAVRVPPFRRGVLVRETERVRDSALHALTDPLDRERVERAAAGALRLVSEAGGTGRAGGADGWRAAS